MLTIIFFCKLDPAKEIRLKDYATRRRESMLGMIEQNTSQIRCQWKWRTKWRVKTVCLQVGINVTTNKAPGRSGLLAASAAILYSSILLHASAKQEFHPICQCPKRGRWTKFPSLVLLDGCLISNSSCHYILSRSFKGAGAWFRLGLVVQIERLYVYTRENDLGTLSF